MAQEVDLCVVVVAEYVPHGDHMHYVPDHYDAVQGTQVAPGVIIPGEPEMVMPAFGKRKMLSSISTSTVQVSSWPVHRGFADREAALNMPIRTVSDGTSAPPF